MLAGPSVASMFAQRTIPSRSIRNCALSCGHCRSISALSVGVLTCDRRRAPGYGAVMKQSPLTLRRWRHVEYERLVNLGPFEEGEPVELIGGQLIVAEPKGSEHATAVEMARDPRRRPPAPVISATP